MRTWTFVLILILLCSPANSADPRWGNLSGNVLVTGEKIPQRKVIIRKNDPQTKDAEICAANELLDDSLIIDPKTGGVANVVISIKKKPCKVIEQKEPLPKREFNSVGCRFEPHVLHVQVNQKYRFTPLDGVAHHHRIISLKRHEFGIFVSPQDPQGVEATFKEPERQPVKVSCDIHPWMCAYFVVTDHPYVGITNEKGEFSIAKLPLGEHDFTVWHESCGVIEKSRKIKIAAGDNKHPAIEVPIETLTKPKAAPAK